MTISYYEKVGSDVICIDAEIPFEIPDTWEWMRLESCCIKEIRRGKSPKYIDESGTLVFAQKCNTKYSGIDVGLALFLDESILGRYPDDEYMQDGDVVINSTGTGTLGRVGIYHTTDNHRGLPIHKCSRKEDVPEKTLFIITTDGYENASKRYDYETVRKMIERQKEKYGWEFLFLGANIDAAAEAKRFGISADRAVNYKCDEEGTALNYEVISEAVCSVRACKPLSADWKKRIDEDVKKRGK